MGNEIMISKMGNDLNIALLEPGDILKVDNIEYIILEQITKQCQTAITRKELLKYKMKFSSGNNNWKESNLRKFLNEKYLKEIENVFGEYRIMKHVVDLSSLDGLNNYGFSIDKVSLLTIDQYRKYRKVLGNILDSWWWLATPDSTLLGESDYWVLCVYPNGRVKRVGHSHSIGGVRPFFILQS